MKVWPNNKCQNIKKINKIKNNPKIRSHNCAQKRFDIHLVHRSNMQKSDFVIRSFQLRLAGNPIVADILGGLGFRPVRHTFILHSIKINAPHIYYRCCFFCTLTAQVCPKITLKKEINVSIFLFFAHGPLNFFTGWSQYNKLLSILNGFHETD